MEVYPLSKQISLIDRFVLRSNLWAKFSRMEFKYSENVTSACFLNKRQKNDVSCKLVELEKVKE